MEASAIDQVTLYHNRQIEFLTNQSSEFASASLWQIR